jgi:hypothetical protein
MFVYRLDTDFTGYRWTKTNCTPIPEFATGLGRTVWTYWTIVGIFDTAMIESDAQKDTIRLQIGKNTFCMTKDMRKLFAGATPAAVQTFESPPACIEPRGYYVDAIDRDRHDGQ